VLEQDELSVLMLYEKKNILIWKVEDEYDI